MNTHSSPPPPSPTHSLIREVKFQKYWEGGATFKKISMRNQKGQGRANAKVIGSCDFSFSFSHY